MILVAIVLIREVHAIHVSALLLVEELLVQCC